MEGMWQVYGGKVASNQRKKYWVNRGKMAGNGGKVAVYKGKVAGKWRECGR